MKFTTLESIDNYYCETNYEGLITIYLKTSAMKQVIENSKQDDKENYQRRLKSDLKKMIKNEKDHSKPRYVKFMDWIESEKSSAYNTLKEKTNLSELILLKAELDKKQKQLEEREMELQIKENRMNQKEKEYQNQIKALEIDNDRLRKQQSFSPKSIIEPNPYEDPYPLSVEDSDDDITG